MNKIKPIVFLPPFLLLLAVIVLSFTSHETFEKVLKSSNTWVLNTFGRVFAAAPFLMLVTCVVVFFSPFGRVRIGGPNAKPLLTKWRWFSITLCTTIAIGILFWATAEPMFQLSDPPKSLGIKGSSPEAVAFAMDTILLHSTCTPYAIFTIAGLMFAFAYYNMKKPFSLGSPLAPLLGRWSEGTFGQIIDAICLYALVAGMSASLGAGLMLLSGGIAHMAGPAYKGAPLIWGVLTVLIVGTFTISAITGLLKGIRVLSNINTVFLIGLVLFVLAFGPTKHILLDGAQSFVRFGAGFVQRHWWTVTTDDPWAKAWTIFYWANWLAWTPISVVFLGRISYGHTVRSFIIFNLLLPAAFTSFWMVVFGSAAIHMQLSQGIPLIEVLKGKDGGPGAVLYAFLAEYPVSWLLIPAFLGAAFLSFVTAADSTTSAMGGLSSTGISPESPEPGNLIKIVWGVMIGLIAWVMVCLARLDGIRMLSDLGGLPALFLCLGITIGLIRVAWNPKKFDTFKDGYDEAGWPLKAK